MPSVGTDLAGLPVHVNTSAFAATDILVRFRPESAAAVAGASLFPGTHVGQSLGLVPDLYQVRLDAGVTVADALGWFRADTRVLSAEPDYQLTVSQVPNDPSFGGQYGLHNIGQNGGTFGADVDAAHAWDVTTGRRSTVVAIMDTGIGFDHQDLYRNLWLNQAEIPTSRRANLRDLDGDGLITFVDLNNSVNQGVGKITDLNGDGRIGGTDLLGTMVRDGLGRDTGQGGWADGSDQGGNGYVDDLIGWNFVNNTNRPLDDHGHGTHVAGTIGATGNDSFGVAGLTWQVQIMSLKFMGASGGGSVSQFINALHYALGQGVRISNSSWTTTTASTSLISAMTAAQARGHIIVAAAGNVGGNSDISPLYPAGVRLDNVLSVAATDRFDNLAGFSNYGANSVHLAAPGVDILSDAPGNSFSTRSGTSMAAPFVTAAVALVWGQHPEWTYRQVIDRILSTVDRLPSLAGRTTSGGRLNAAAAVGWTAHTPLSIVSSSASGAAFNTLDKVRVTFNQPINPTSFTPSDVTLRTPSGLTIAPTSVRAVAGSNNTQFELMFAVQSAGGSYVLTVGRNVLTPSGFLMTAAYSRTFSLDPRVTVTSAATVSIPSRNSAASALTFGQNLTITDINVRVTIAFPRDGQIQLRLIGPDGTTIVLSDYRGGTGANFQNTLFDDQAITPIGSAAAPFAGSFRPDFSLSALNGRNARGTWRLVAYNRVTGMTGSITGWSLTVVGRATTPTTAPPAGSNSMVTMPALLPRSASTWSAVDVVFALGWTPDRTRKAA